MVICDRSQEAWLLVRQELLSLLLYFLGGLLANRWVKMAASVLQHDLPSRCFHFLPVQLVVFINRLYHIALNQLQILDHLDLVVQRPVYLLLPLPFQLQFV